MASVNPLRKVIDWFNASDVIEADPDGVEPTSPPPAAPESSQKRQRGALMLRSTNEGGMEIRHPRHLDDRMEIGMDLKHRRLVTLDLTHLPEAEARFFLEFIYGVVFALDATAEKVTDGIYLLAPHGVVVRNNGDSDVPTPQPSRGSRTRDVQEELFWQGN